MDIDLRVSSDNYIRVSAIRRSDDHQALDSITSVTAKILLDSTDALVTNSDITLTVVSGQANAYQGNFPSTVVLTHNTVYRVQITVVGVVDTVSRTLVEEHEVTAKRG